MKGAATLQCALQAHQTQLLVGRRIIRQFCALHRCAQWHIPGPFGAQTEAPFLINRPEPLRKSILSEACLVLDLDEASTGTLTCTMAECGK